MVIVLINVLIKNFIFKHFYLIGDWGLGIGDWAQSPIPNPQSPKILIIYINSYIIHIIIHILIHIFFSYYI